MKLPKTIFIEDADAIIEAGFIYKKLGGKGFLEKGTLVKRLTQTQTKDMDRYMNKKIKTKRGGKRVTETTKNLTPTNKELNQIKADLGNSGILNRTLAGVKLKMHQAEEFVKNKGYRFDLQKTCIYNDSIRIEIEKELN